MWYDFLQKNELIKNLYNRVPDLNQILIKKIKINNNRNQISVSFDLPYYVDYPPKDWGEQCNIVMVQIDFLKIHSFYLQSATNCSFFGYAKINKYKNTDLLHMDIIGILKADIVAESAQIRWVKGFCCDPWIM